LVALLLTLLTPIVASAAPGTPARAQRVYLALGDSLAFGIGASTPQNGYVGLLGSFFQMASHGNVDTTLNLSVPGETAGSFITGGQLAQAVAAIDNSGSNTRVLTLDIGGNDLLPLLQTEPCKSDPAGTPCAAVIAAALARVAADYPVILGRLQEALARDPGRTRVLVMTYYNPFSGTGSPFEQPTTRALLGSDGVVDCAADAGDPARVGLNDIIVCNTRASRAQVVDVFPAFVGRGLQLTHIGSGDIHPNDAGYQVIASVFEGVFPPQ
jgi:lysophospholipase L1-like esterase